MPDSLLNIQLILFFLPPNEPQGKSLEKKNLKDNKNCKWGKGDSNTQTYDLSNTSFHS